MEQEMQRKKKKSICPYCGGMNTRKNGHTRKGTQQYLCRNSKCGKAFADEKKRTISPRTRKAILSLLRAGRTVRDIHTMFEKECSMSFIYKLQNKCSATLSPFNMGD